jgi:GNAT superfamily N-acetyltransferase
VTIHPCGERDFDSMYAVVNAAATAYDGVIPADRYHVPYMPAEELRAEIAAGVRFWGWYEAGEGGAEGDESFGAEELLGLMGIQDVDDVTLIRHAYVLPEHQGTGIGGALLAHLMGTPHLAALPRRPLLVGTWADAVWAVRFYERHGFRLVTPAEKDRLLRRYWHIPERQVETSVVLRFSPSPPPGEAAPRAG